MNIIVCVKTVIEENNVVIDSKGNINRESLKLKINKSDEYALENALILKDKFKFEVVTVTMGPPNANEILKDIYSKGVDKTILITDPLLKGSDCLITSKVLAAAVKKIAKENFIILTGVSSDDAHTSIIPAQLSCLLNIPAVFAAKFIELESEKVKIETISSKIEIKKIPLLISIDISSKLKPRISPLNLRIKAKNYNPINLTLKDLELMLDGKDSPTFVEKVTTNSDSKKKETKFINIDNNSDIENLKKLIYE
ncbi:MAG: hypothetical protein N2Z20_02425 [Elusimicrobiales bacterium]|nr:hypothetical protein [Elusimicrobiales bacterium]